MKTTEWTKSYSVTILGGVGGLGISSDGDDLMRVKIKTKKISRASNKPPKNPWTEN